MIQGEFMWYAVIGNDKCDEEKEHAILDGELKAWPRCDMQGLNEIDTVTEATKRQVAYIPIWDKSKHSLKEHEFN